MIFDWHDFDAVAFDLDGTLANSIPVHLRARLAAFREMAEITGDERYLHVPTEIQAAAHHHGSSPYTIIGWTLWKVGIVAGKESDAYADPQTVALVEKKNEAYSQLIGLADEMPGAVDFVHVAARRWPDKIAILSVARRDAEAIPFLKHHNLLQYFPDERMVTRESVPVNRLKPHPDAVNLLLERLSLLGAPRKLLVIEDSPHGVQAANRAGATPLAVATTKSLDELEQLRGEERPAFVAADFTALRAML